MNEWLQNQNQCGIWCRRLSIGLSTGTLKAKNSNLDLTTGKCVAKDSNKNTASSWKCLWKQLCFVRSTISSARKLAASATIVITSNLEFSSVCRKKNHSQDHWNALTCLELHTQTWTCCKKAESTIVGTSMWIEVCQTHAQHSRSSQHWMKNLQEGFCGPAACTNSSNCQTWKNVARDLVSTKRKAAMGCRGTDARQCAKVEVHFLSIRKIWSSKQPWKTRGKVGSAYGSSCASWGQEPPVHGNLWRVRHSQIEACMHHGSSRVHEKAFGMNSAKRSRRSHCREGVQFIKSLQSCAQVHSCAPSNENTLTPCWLALLRDEVKEMGGLRSWVQSILFPLCGRPGTSRSISTLPRPSSQAARPTAWWDQRLVIFRAQNLWSHHQRLVGSGATGYWRSRDSRQTSWSKRLRQTFFLSCSPKCVFISLWLPNACSVGESWLWSPQREVLSQCLWRTSWSWLADLWLTCPVFSLTAQGLSRSDVYRNCHWFSDLHCNTRWRARWACPLLVAVHRHTWKTNVESVSKIVDWPPTVLSSSTARGHSKQKIQTWISQQGNVWRKIRTRTQHRVNKWGNQMWIRASVQGNDKESHRYKIVSPQYEKNPELRRLPWETLPKRTTKAWSATKRRHASGRRQHVDLGAIHVRDNEGAPLQKTHWLSHASSRIFLVIC